MDYHSADNNLEDDTKIVLSEDQGIKLEHLNDFAQAIKMVISSGNNQYFTKGINSHTKLNFGIIFYLSVGDSI